MDKIKIKTPIFSWFLGGQTVHIKIWGIYKDIWTKPIKPKVKNLLKENYYYKWI